MKHTLSTVSPLLAVLPCSVSAVLAAHGAHGELMAGSAHLAILAIAALALARSYRRGYWNTAALAYLAGWPLGAIAGAVRPLIGG